MLQANKMSNLVISQKCERPTSFGSGKIARNVKAGKPVESKLYCCQVCDSDLKIF